ncbi:MAG: DMT family transporter [Candidatus Tectomicrobia bacterium]|nr:DMT family transporter [Candidatus Tectomicrobia bacterium]
MDSLWAAQIFSLLAALGLATGDAAARFGLRASTPITGILVLMVTTLVMYGPLAVATFRPEEMELRGLLILVAAGFAAPGLAGTLHYMSFRRIGLSRSVAIVGSSPLITVIFAVVTLGERPNWLVYWGTVLIVAGVISLAREQRGAGSRGEAGRKPVWYYFVLPAVATLLFGAAATLRKVGISMIPNLSVALSASAIGGLLTIALWHPFLPREERVRLGRRNVGYFVANGVLVSLGHLAFFAALQRGPLSIVAPLVYTTPLFALAFSWLLFREVERLNTRLAASALLICVGAALVTLSRG